MKKQILIATLLTLSTAATATLAVAKPGFGPARERPTFEQLDADGDGALSQAELAAQGQKRFAAADADGDGLLSAEELATRAQERIAKRTDAMIERFDKNGDGALSAEEMPQHRGPQRILERADTDGNGTISKAEFDTAQAILDAVMKKKHHRGGPDKRDHGADAE